MCYWNNKTWLIDWLITTNKPTVARTHGVWQKRRDSVLMLLTNGVYAVLFASHILQTLLTYRYGHKPTNPQVYSLIQQRRLKLFGHTARCAASEDHSRALRASTDRLPVDWRHPRGRPRQSWLRTIDSDLKPLNLGLHYTLHCDPSWRRIVETAMLFERATWWWQNTCKQEI